MSLTTELPDDQGWYWCKGRDSRWYMAFVDTSQERVCYFDGDDPGDSPFICDFDAPQHKGISTWYGPFNCPGGDFGGCTVVPSEDDFKRAKRQRKPIGITHFDYRFCRDEGHGSSITISGVYTREEADKRIRREVALETATHAVVTQDAPATDAERTEAGRARVFRR